MKRFLIFSLIFCLVIGLFFVNKKVTIVSDYNYKLDDNSLSCPGSATCCESGYNVMCHMVDPIKNYHVLSVLLYSSLHLSSYFISHSYNKLSTSLAR